MTDDRVSPRWVHWRETVNLEEYHLRWQRMEQQGTASHGEADFIGTHAAPGAEGGIQLFAFVVNKQRPAAGGCP